MKKVLLFLSLYLIVQTSKSQTSYTWNGSISTAWNTPGNWSPSGVPGAIDNITIVNTANTCVLNANASINNITVSSGTLNLGGNTLTANGTTATFSTGTVQNGTINVTSANTTTFGNGPFTMNCIANITSASITLKNTTFQNTVTITKTGGSNDQSTGNNIFNAPVTFTNAGSGYLMLGNGNGDQFNNSSTFNNIGSSTIYIAYNGSNNIFGGVANFNNSPTANTGIYVSWYSAGTVFNNNIFVSSTSGQGVQFCGGNSTASATLTGMNTLSIGAAGFSGGILSLRQFVQSGTAPISLTATGTTAQINLGPSSTFNGSLNISSPNIYPFNSVFNGSVTLTKTDGTSSNVTSGGDTYNNTLTVNYTSSNGNGYWSFGYGSPDVYNGDVYLNNNSLDRIIMGHNSANNQFNGNIFVTQNGSSAGINLTWNLGSSCSMAAGKSIYIGAAGFSVGFLAIQGLTQNGNAPINLTTTGTSSIYIGDYSANNPSIIGGSMNLTAPDIYLRGGTFNAPVSVTKTGGGGDHNNGNQNIFNSTLAINQQSNTGYFLLGYNSNDLFNGNISLTSTGTGGISFGWNSGTGTPTLSAGNTISIGAAGFSAGYLMLGGFTQLGNAPINLNFTGSNTSFQIGQSSVIGGNLTVVAASIYTNGAIFSGVTSFTKTGSSGQWSNGGNTFNGTTTINNIGSGFFGFANGAPDIYNGDLYVNNNSTERIIFGNNSTGNQFNGNLILTQIGSSVGIAFGWSASTNETMAAGKTISIGAAGLNVGYLQIERFTQLGNAAMNLPLSGTASLVFGPNSTIGGNLIVTTPTLYLNGTTFNGTSNFTKTGSTGDWGQGGNIFNNICSITNSGSSYLLLGGTNPDIWNSDVIFTDSGSERLLPCWSSIGNQFNGNIYVNTSGSAQGIQFCGGNSTATATQAPGGSIYSGTIGLNAGYLILRQFTQLGNAPINLTLNSTSTYLQFGPSSTFGGNIVSTSPGLYFNGSIFNGTVNATKTGTTNDASSGNNIFNDTSTFTNNGSGYLMFGNGNADQFNSASTFNNMGSNNIYVAWNSSNNVFGGTTTFNNSPTTNNLIYVSWLSSGTVFNNNIVVSSTNGSGVQFCGAANATATIAAGYGISIGPAGFSSGTLLLQRFTQLGSAPVNLLLTGSGNLTFGPSSSFGGNVVSSSPTLYLNGCTFNNSSNLTKTGSTNDWGQGGNVFNGVCNITNNGTNYLLLGGTNPDIWNNDVTFTNNSTDRLLLCWSSIGNQFNGNIYVNTSGSAQGIQFCGGNNTATATQAPSGSIYSGTIGLNAGYLILRQFTQLGNSPINLNLSSTATYLQFGPSSSFGGNIVSSSPGLYFNGAIFNGTVNSTKTGSSNDYANGNNVFNDTVNMTNTGSGYLLFGGGNGDQFNSTSTFNNVGSSYIYVAYNSTNNVFGGLTTFNNFPTANTLIFVSWVSSGTLFNNNIVVNSTSGQGVQFCGSSTASAILSAGNTISVGSTGFSAGTLLLQRFSQIGATDQNIILTGTGNLTFGPTSSFGGNVVASSPTLLLNGCTFNGTTNLTKTGASGDWGQGGNVFNGTSNISNYGSSYLLLGGTNPDIWNSDVTFSDFGSERIIPAWSSTGNQFNGNIFLNTSGSAQGIAFCNGSNTATATQAANFGIFTGSTGLNAGYVILRQFTQQGNGSINLTLNSTATYLQFGPSSLFGGNIVSTSPGLYFNSSTFGGTVNSTKTGSSNDASPGNNIFNAPFTVTNIGAGYFLMGNGNPDVWNASATFNNQSTAQHMYIAYNSTGNTFNGDVTFNNQPGSTGLWIYPNYYGVNTMFNGNITVTNLNGAGIYFGTSSGTATLATGYSINVGANGFNMGGLIFRNFTQTGSSNTQNITTTGTSNIQYGPSATFNGQIVSSSPGLLFNGATFNGIVNSTKTGSSNDQSQGNNQFNAPSTFTNNGSGYLMMANSGPDAYNSDVTFIKTSSGLIYPNYNYNCTYSGNLNLTSNSAITFGANTGTATFNGNGLQNINATLGSPTPVFSRLVINNTGSGVTLNSSSINVSGNLTLTSGLLNTSTNYILTMLNGSSVAAGTALSTSFVNGPMNYQKSTAGSSILNFPIGNNSDCRPVVLTVNHTNGTLYNYQATLYNASAAALNYTLPSTIDLVSKVHYYTIARTDGSGNSQPSTGLSGNQTIQVFFGPNDLVVNGGTLVIAKNTYLAPTAWINIGGTGGPIYEGGTSLTGSITSTSSPSAFNSFSTFTLADQVGGLNPLPVQLLYFNAKLGQNNIVNLTWATASESNNNYFTIEKSSDGINFEYFQKINSKAVNGNSNDTLNYITYDPNPYNGYTYYRLTQTDLNGNTKVWNIVWVNLNQTQTISFFPNPTSGTVFIKGFSSTINSINIQWYDVSGRIMKQETVAVINGMGSLNAPFANGLYILKYTADDGSTGEQRIIIQK